MAASATTPLHLLRLLLLLLPALASLNETLPSLTSPSHYPLCCVRFVHLPKAGGSTFHDFLQKPSVALDVDDFHNPWTHFLDQRKANPEYERRCFTGAALRDPASRFVSAFDYCLGRGCQRPWAKGGFLDAKPNWQEEKRYQQGNLDIRGYLESPRQQTNSGDNVQTKQLGLRPKDVTTNQGKPGSPANVNRVVVQQEVLEQNEHGQAVLKQAKAALGEMDFVLLTDQLSVGIQSTFDRSPPSQVINPGKRVPSRLTTAQRAEVEARNSLDLDLYRHAQRLVSNLTRPVQGQLVDAVAFQRGLPCARHNKCGGRVFHAAKGRQQCLARVIDWRDSPAESELQATSDRAKKKAGR